MAMRSRRTSQPTLASGPDLGAEEEKDVQSNADSQEKMRRSGPGVGAENPTLAALEAKHGGPGGPSLGDLDEELEQEGSEQDEEGGGKKTGGGAAGGGAGGDGAEEPGGAEGEGGDGAGLDTQAQEEEAQEAQAQEGGQAEVAEGEGAETASTEVSAAPSPVTMAAPAVEIPERLTPTGPSLSVDASAALALGEGFDAGAELALIEGRIAELTSRALSDQETLLTQAEGLAAQAASYTEGLRAENAGQAQASRDSISGAFEQARANVEGQIETALGELASSAETTRTTVTGLIAEHQTRIDGAVETGRTGAEGAGTAIASTLQSTIDLEAGDLAAKGSTFKGDVNTTAQTWADSRSGSGPEGRLKASCEKQAAKKLGDDYGVWIDGEMAKTAQEARAMATGVSEAAPGSITGQVVSDLEERRTSAEGRLQTSLDGAIASIESQQTESTESLEAARQSHLDTCDTSEEELLASVDTKEGEIDEALGTAGDELGERLRAQGVELANVHAQLLDSLKRLESLPQPLQMGPLADTFDQLSDTLDSNLAAAQAALDEALSMGITELDSLAVSQGEGLTAAVDTANSKIATLESETTAAVDTAHAEVDAALLALSESTAQGLEPWTAELETAGTEAPTTVQGGLDALVVKIQNLFSDRTTNLETAVSEQLAKFGEYVAPKAAQEFEAEKGKIDGRTQDLRKAMDGWGTDEGAIFKALRETPKEGMAYLEHLYNLHYSSAGHPLRGDFSDELGGSDYDIALAYLTGDRAKAIRLELDQSRGIFNDDEARIEAVLMAADADDIKALAADPESKQVIADVRDCLGGADLDVFNALVNPNLSRDQAKAQAGAARLYEAMDGMGTDEDEVYKRLEACKTPEERKALEEAFNTYAKDKGSSWAKDGDALKTAIGDEFSGAEEDLANALADGNKAGARAARLELAADGMGTDEHKVFDNLKNPDLKIDPSTATNPIEKARLEKKKADAEKEQADVKTIYAEKYGRSVDEMIADEMGDASEKDNYEAQVAKQYLDKGDADPELLIQYSIDGAGTDEEILKDALRGKSKAEIAQIKAAYKEKYGKDLEEALGVNDHSGWGSEVSGKDAHELEIMLMGNPETYEDYKKIADKNVEFARGGFLGENLMVLGDAVGWTDSAHIMKHNVAKLDEAYEAVPESERNKKADASFAQQAEFVNSDATMYGDKLDSLVDTLVTTLELIAGAVATVLTAGAASPALAAIVANLCIGATGVALKALARGDRMGYEEILAESGKVVISSLTAGAAEMKSLGAVSEKIGGKITNATLGKFLNDPAKLKAMADITAGGVQNVLVEVPGALAQTALDEKTWEMNGGDLIGHFAKTAGSTTLSSMANGAVSTKVDTKIGERSSIGGTVLKETTSGLAGDTAGYMVDPANYGDAEQFWNGLGQNTVESLKNNGVNAVGNAKARKYKAAAEIARDPNAAADYQHLSPEEKAWVEQNLPAYQKRVEEGSGTSMIEMALSGKGADTPVEDPSKKPATDNDLPVTEEGAIVLQSDEEKAVVEDKKVVEEKPVVEDVPVVKTEEKKAAGEEGGDGKKTGNAEHFNAESSFHGSHDKHNSKGANVGSHLRGLTDYVDGVSYVGGKTVAKVKIPGTETLVDVTIVIGKTKGSDKADVDHAASFVRHEDGTYTITVSEGLLQVDLQRALAHELSEIRFAEGRSKHGLDKDSGEGTLGKDGDHHGLELSSHDVGRLGELDLLFRKSKHQKQEVRDRQQAELTLLLDHLGLNPKDPGYDQKMMLIREAVAQGYVSKDVLVELERRNGQSGSSLADDLTHVVESSSKDSEKISKVIEDASWIVGVMSYTEREHIEQNLKQRVKNGSLKEDEKAAILKKWEEKQKAVEAMDKGLAGEDIEGDLITAVKNGSMGQDTANHVRSEVKAARLEMDLINTGMQKGDGAFDDALHKAIADGHLDERGAEKIRQLYEKKTAALDKLLLNSGMLDNDTDSARMLELHAKHANLSPEQVEALKRRVQQKQAQAGTADKAKALADAVTNLSSSQLFGEPLLEMVRGLKTEGDAKVFRETIQKHGMSVEQFLEKLSSEKRLSSRDLAEFRAHVMGDAAGAAKAQVMNSLSDEAYKEKSALYDSKGTKSVLGRAKDAVWNNFKKVVGNSGQVTSEAMKHRKWNKDELQQKALNVLAGLSAAERQKLLADPEFADRVAEMRKSFTKGSAEQMMFDALTTQRKVGGDDHQTLDAWQLETTTTLAVAQVEQCFENMHKANDKKKGQNFRAQLQSTLATLGRNPTLYEAFLKKYAAKNGLNSEDPRAVAAHLSKRIQTDIYTKEGGYFSKRQYDEVDHHAQDANRDLVEIAELNRKDQKIVQDLKVMDSSVDAIPGTAGDGSLDTDQKLRILKAAMDDSNPGAQNLRKVLELTLGDAKAIQAAIAHLEKKQTLERSARAELVLAAIKSGRTQEAASLLTDPVLAQLDEKLRKAEAALKTATGEEKKKLTEEVAQLQQAYEERGLDHKAFLKVVEGKLQGAPEAGDGRDTFSPKQIEVLAALDKSDLLKRLTTAMNQQHASGDGFSEIWKADGAKTERELAPELLAALKRAGIDLDDPQAASIKLAVLEERGLLSADNLTALRRFMLTRHRITPADDPNAPAPVGRTEEMDLLAKEAYRCLMTDDFMAKVKLQEQLDGLLHQAGLLGPSANPALVEAVMTIDYYAALREYIADHEYRKQFAAEGQQESETPALDALIDEKLQIEPQKKAPKTDDYVIEVTALLNGKNTQLGTRNDARFVKELMQQGHQKPHDIIAQSLLGLFGLGMDTTKIQATLNGRSPEELAAIGKAFYERYGHLSFASSWTLGKGKEALAKDSKKLLPPGDSDATPSENTHGDDFYRAWMATLLNRVTGGRVGHDITLTATYGDTKKVFDPDKDGHDATKAKERLALEDGWLRDSWAHEQKLEKLVVVDRLGDALEKAKGGENGTGTLAELAKARADLDAFLAKEKAHLETGHPEAWRRYEALKTAYQTAVKRRVQERAADSKTYKSWVSWAMKALTLGGGLEDVPGWMLPIINKFLGIGAGAIGDRELSLQDVRNDAVGGAFGSAMKWGSGSLVDDHFGDTHGRKEDGSLNDAAKAAKADGKLDDVATTLGTTAMDKGIKRTMDVQTSRDDDKTALMKQNMWTDAGALLKALGGIGISELRDNDGATDSKQVDTRSTAEKETTSFATNMVNKAYDDWVKKGSPGGLVQSAEDKRKASAKGEKTLQNQVGGTGSDEDYTGALTTQEKLQQLLDAKAIDPGKLIQLAYQQMNS